MSIHGMDGMAEDGGSAAVGAAAPPVSWRNDADRYLMVPRSPWYRLVVGLQDVVTVSTVRFWHRYGARAMPLPVTTGNISEPAGPDDDASLVRVRIEGRETYLSASTQFRLEYGCRLSPQGCYYTMPSFRAERSDSSHLGEFLHSEVELPVDLRDLQRLVESCLRFTVAAMLDEHGDELRRIVGDVSHLERMAGRDAAFASVSFDEADRVLDGDGRYVRRRPEGRTLTRAGERELMRRVDEFVWVTHWDHLAVPFYHARDTADPRLVRNADLLFGMGETIGAGERHTTGRQTREALQAHDLPVGQYDWYVRMKDEFPMRTSGFGLGVERFLMWVLDHDDIRDIPPFPRTPDVPSGP